MKMITPVVGAAMARHMLTEKDLRSWEVHGADVYLYLKSGLCIRVEISSLPAVVVEMSRAPEHAQAKEPEPERASQQISKSANRQRPKRKK